MTEKRAGMSKEKVKKLKINKETIKDLDAADGKARVIKGGVVQTREPGLMYCSQKTTC